MINVQVRGMIEKYYEKKGNNVGGNLHIVLDDMNYEKEHILFCRERALEHKDEDGIALADALLGLSPIDLADTIDPEGYYHSLVEEFLDWF